MISAHRERLYRAKLQPAQARRKLSQARTRRTRTAKRLAETTAELERLLPPWRLAVAHRRHVQAQRRAREAALDFDGAELDAAGDRLVEHGALPPERVRS
jgi:hypothetical protein